LNTPAFYNFKFVDPQGNLTSEAQLFMASVNQAMVGALSDEGWTFPQHTTAEITALAAGSTLPNGTTWFNTTTSKLNVKTADSTVQVITST